MFKKAFYLMSLLAVATTYVACSDDDNSGDNSNNETVSELEKSYFSIEDATYKGGDIPEATTSEELEGIEMSNQVMNGAMNYINVVTEQQVAKFFIGIKDVEGYWEYVPENTDLVRASSHLNTYVIPMMMSQEYTGDTKIVLSGQLENGDVTTPVESEIFYIETMPGAIEVKLAFSNSKDIDLHLYTPSGEHIYYGHRGGVFTNEFGEEITYGLDIDSNAACHLDNINKENIYIPSELVEAGEYRVVVDMYSNCRPSVATDWSIVARYEGNPIVPTSGQNTALGTYEVGAPDGDMTEVMRFTVIEESNDAPRKSIRKNWKFVPTPLSESDSFKLDFIAD